MRKRQPAQQQPHFTIEAQPRAIATELAALSDDTEVSYSCNIAGWQTTSRTSAKALRAQIEAIIERQRQGHYTLTEAAQMLTDAGGVGVPESHLVQLQRAWADGSLPVHQGGSRYLRRSDEVICTHDDTVTVADLDDWLLKHQTTGHGFPVADSASLPTTAARAPVSQEPGPDRGRRVKRAALIADNSRRWPTIERDLKDAATNGLSEAAKDRAAFGWWWEGSAIEWARARAKVQGIAPGLASMTGIVHRLPG